MIAAPVAIVLSTRRQRAELRQPATVTYLFRDLAPILLIALPMTLIIITGEIDLSVASIVGLEQRDDGILTGRRDGRSLAAAAGDPARRGAGASTASSSRSSGCPSLAVTIGTLALFRGIAVGLLGTKAVTDFPEKWTDLAKEQHPDDAEHPVIMIPSSCSRSSSACCCTSRRSGGALRDRAQQRGRHFTGINVGARSSGSS